MNLAFPKSQGFRENIYTKYDLGIKISSSVHSETKTSRDRGFTLLTRAFNGLGVSKNPRVFRENIYTKYDLGQNIIVRA